jgi:hypothetical protein
MKDGWEVVRMEDGWEIGCEDGRWIEKGCEDGR